MRLLAIDPGPTETAIVWLYDGNPSSKAKLPNEQVRIIVASCYEARGQYPTQSIVCEMIASYGKPVGQETFETCIWIGRFIEASGGTCQRLFRRDVTKHLCGSSRKVTDGVIRQRMIDIYGRGRGKEFAIGLKKTPGPLYGFREDEWQALALGVAFGEMKIGWKIQ